jgi:hypothetical protein
MPHYNTPINPVKVATQVLNLTISPTADILYFRLRKREIVYNIDRLFLDPFAESGDNAKIM